MQGGRSDADAIVVGASLAGCRAALTLAEHGHSVLLLDKCGFPRWKPCAGGVTLKAVPYVPEPLRSRFERPIRGAYVTFGEDHATRISADETLGWMVHRETFDAAHVELAEACRGIEVLLGATVRSVVEGSDAVVVETTDTEYRGRVVIGADGVNSVVSRALPGDADRRIGFAYEGEATFERSELADHALFDLRKFPSGYGWIFPKADHYSIGGYVYGQPLNGIRELYDEFCSETRLLSSCATYRTRGYRIPHGGGERKLNTDRVVLAGDAADLVDPLTGEGIYYALRSGQLAGQAAAAFLARGTSLDAYDRRVAREIRDDFRFAKRLAAVIYRYPQAAFHLFFKVESMGQWFTELVAGRRNYREFHRALIRRGWLLPFGLGPRARPRVPDPM